jgi:hypothetical protein
VEVVPLVVEVKLTMLILSEFLKRVVVGCPYGTLCVEAVLQTACVASWVSWPPGHFCTSLDSAGFLVTKMLA